MKNFLVCRHFSFVLILSSILVSPSLGNKRLGVGFNEPERTIFRDDYGTSLTDSDCPTRVDENPKFTFSNETHSYPSYYFSLYCVARYPVAVEFDGAKVIYLHILIHIYACIVFQFGNSPHFTGTSLNCKILSGQRQPRKHDKCLLRDPNKSTIVPRFGQSCRKLYLSKYSRSHKVVFKIHICPE